MNATSGCLTGSRDAARHSGRVPGDVRLVIVTKSQPVEVVQAAIAAGACILGENYAEEAAAKIAALRNNIRGMAYDRSRAKQESGSGCSEFFHDTFAG